ncbi:enoyl-CoA hydratase/isomerase family protein [Nocardiopsis potens]|uniref:enoyl-CoA hydratase/isomerase family protein n=1 Tax=Nocardiopsis potens TaxID=1246458 RepID=UPI00034ACF86|nr:enoyl-CoA hydratase/isomerase family protein [Nocardiopsis potens]
MSETRSGGGRPPSVECEVEGGVGVIRLNRPECLNAVDGALVEELGEAFDRVARAHAGAVVLAGRGRAFCAGHDLKEPAADPAELPARLERTQDLTRRIRACPAPVIAAVHGHAVGIGVELALCCDLVIAAEDARFRFPEAGLGLSITNAASRLLPLLVGPLKAKELVLLGEPVDAAEAHRIGLVNTVVPAGALMDAALERAARLAGQPRAATALAKEALTAGTEQGVEAALELEVRHALRTERPAALFADPVGASRARDAR